MRSAATRKARASLASANGGSRLKMVASIAPVSRRFTAVSLFYFEDETFAARAAIPPPKRGDSFSRLAAPQVQIVARNTDILISSDHVERK
jgi:hypothetical protein